MSRDVQLYAFEASVPADEIEGTLLLSVLAAEGLHGQSRVRRDAAYCFDAEKRACVIDVGSVVGRDISNIFSGLAAHEFGETAFTVRRANDAPESVPDELQT